MSRDHLGGWPPEVCPPGPLTELASVLVGQHQLGGSGSSAEACQPRFLLEGVSEDSVPQFTELRTVDQDSSFSSLGLSTSACSLSMLEGLEATAADDGLSMLADPNQLGQNGTDSRETANTTDVLDSAGVDKPGRAKSVSYADKHPLLPPPEICGRERCRKKCATNIPTARRSDINRAVMDMSWQARALWYRSNVHVTEVGRKRTSVSSKVQRQKSLVWHLPNAEGKLVQVCKGFFLTAVGLKTTNDEPVRTALNMGSVSAVDGRGRRTPPNKKDPAVIRDHIESFRPCAPHYRYLHAPHRRYLPSDVTVVKMHKDFLETHPEQDISYQRYRQEVASMKISFTVLGHEQCETCKIHAHHNMTDHGLGKNSVDDHTDGCDACARHREHITRARDARAEYRRDADREWDQDETICSADLMKVSLVPVLPHKAAVFTPRLIVFNETFAPLVQKGARSQKEKPLGVLWHEALAGRDADDVAATFWRYLMEHRDKKVVTIYADNCAGQQKSWVFATVIMTYVQQCNNATEKITIKYLETGHTAMSADAAHQVIQKKMAKAQSVCDFRDFVELVEESGVRVITMKSDDFFNFEDGISRSKLSLLGKGLRPNLRDVRVMQARRGDDRLYIKTSHTAQAWRGLQLMKATYDPSEAPQKRKTPRGVNKAKIDRLCQSLLPLMPPHKRPFWLQLQTEYANSARDLTQ